VFALSSKSEQAPLSVLEAMAAGLPVVAPKVGDIPKMVGERNVHFLPPERTEVQLRDFIGSFAKYPEERSLVGEENRARVRALFDEGEMIAAYARLYGAAMGRPDALQ